MLGVDRGWQVFRFGGCKRFGWINWGWVVCDLGLGRVEFWSVSLLLGCLVVLVGYRWDF